MRGWILVCLLALTIVAPRPVFAVQAKAAAMRRKIAGTVKDALGRPVSDVAVHLQTASGKTAAATSTDKNGAFAFRDVAPRLYAIITSKPGFETSTQIVDARSASPPPLTISMASKRPLTLSVVSKRLPARNALSAETGSSVYRFSSRAIEQLPQGSNTPLSRVLIQAPGVSQDVYGQGQEQIHIHGMNGGGIQYRINGIWLPEPVTSFGEIFSPRFVSSVNLVTGFQPAQFGYHNEGVIDIHTRQGCESPGGSVEYYGGQRATIQPSFEYGGCSGRLSYYLSGFYLQDDLGVQSPTPTPDPIHDRTTQGQGFGYFSYLLTPTTRLSLIAGSSVNYFQIPGQPNLPPQYALSGISTAPPSDNLDESQFEQNYYGILALQGSIGPNLNYQLAYFSRYYSLGFTPDPVGDLIYNGIAANIFHSGFVNGLQEDTAYHLGRYNTLMAGLYISGEVIELDDHARVFPLNSIGMPETVPINVVDNTNADAFLYGVYLQDEWHPTEKLRITAGVRWDLMDAFVRQHQFSPRFGLVYQLTPSTTLHAGYARYFQVPPFSSVLLKTVDTFANTTGASSVTSGNQRVKAEDDNFFDAGFTQELPLGLDASVESWFLLAHNKLDLAQYGSTYIFAPLNYRNGRGWGVDFSLTRDVGRLSTYANFSYVVLQAKDISAGQFLADDPAEIAYVAKHWIPLDDDQEFTASYGVSYLWRGFLLTVDGIWGSGYRAGFANSQTLSPIWEVDMGLARSLTLPRVGKVRARVSVLNVFDHPYEIRNGTGIGVFAPAFGPRRALYAGIRLPLPGVSQSTPLSP